MIAQIVFDLPLEGLFDYIVPEPLTSLVKTGVRVKVFFGPRRQIGYCVGLLDKSTIAKLKPIQSLVDDKPIFNELDLSFAKDFSAYYGCSLGEALGAMLHQKSDLKPSLRREHQGQLTLFRYHPSSYAEKIQQIVDGYRQKYQDKAGDYCKFLILVPDAFVAQRLSMKFPSVKIGARSAVFEADGQYDCVIMVDEEDSSFKQEQTPMYQTRHVLLTRSAFFGFDVAFVALSPSVELMEMVKSKKIKLIDEKDAGLLAVKLVDLTNYKFVRGLISPPLTDALTAALKVGKKSILILNRKGSYRMTRCTDCGEVLKCHHCDSSLIYSRQEKKFLCRHCTFSLPGETNCPKCRKPSWRSQGIGVEQVQNELKKNFPLAKILAFERPLNPKKGQEVLADFDILVSTSAVLRFQEKWEAKLAAFIDIDAELNRMQTGSAFEAFHLMMHVASMASDPLLVQTRNPHHHVLQSLMHGKVQEFYDEELKLREELGFSPFKHWVQISWRSKLEKSAQDAAQDVYNILKLKVPSSMHVTTPLADMLSRKRDQFRFNVVVQTENVPEAMDLIKSAIHNSKRRSRVIVTLNVDP